MVLYAGAVLLAIIRGAAAAHLHPAEILERAEAVRNPDGAYGLDMRITTSWPGREEMVSSFRVYTNGRLRTLAYQVEPAALAGRRMLVVERQAWLYLPGAARPLHVFLQHLLTGEVASGDIARMPLSALYDPVAVSEEEAEGTPCFLLELRTGAPGATYSRILYWVSKRGYRPVRMEFYALSGRRMKTGLYGDYRHALGGPRPTRLVLEDAVDPGYRSVLEFKNFRRVGLPDSLFVPEALAAMVEPPDEAGGGAAGRRRPSGSLAAPARQPSVEAAPD